MPHYFLYSNAQHMKDIWEINPDVAKRVDVTNPQGGANTYFERDGNETIWETLARKVPVWFGPGTETIRHELKLAPGQYYPRIARPLYVYPDHGLGRSPGNQDMTNEIAVTRGQLVALTRQLQRICETVHPSTETFNVYGHEIRNLLILACTEVEAHWRGVLNANGASKSDDRFSTKDYVKVTFAMRLSEYSISFPFYPWISPIRPFEKWGTTGQPTRELDWYDSYNTVKHDREKNFKKATLENAFKAVSACAVMMLAQFGDPNHIEPRSELQYFFQPKDVPRWPPSEVYSFPFDHSGWVPQKFVF
jgi:hypothetical protein